jgi:hypothetical protein
MRSYVIRSDSIKIAYFNFFRLYIGVYQIKESLQINIFTLTKKAKNAQFESPNR